MWRDFWRFIGAVLKQTTFVLTGTVIAVALVLWPHVAPLVRPRAPREIPDQPFWGLVALSFFWATFLAWREEHGKVAAPKGSVDPELELRRPQFEKKIAKLNPEQEAVLRHVVQVGDSDAMQLRDNFFRDQGKSVSVHDARLLLLDIAETTGVLEATERGTASPRYGIKPAWAKLLVEWAAPPTAVDKKIADKARALRRTLAASFDDWPAGLNKLDDLTTWAAKLRGGFPTTERTLTEIVELRPDASGRVERTVGTARDAYDAAADIINRLFKKGGLSIDEHNREAVGTQLREAVAHVKECLAALDTLFT